MASQRCPNCGAEVPEETGQHATTPSAGVVNCPSCGANVALERPGAAQQSAPPSPDVPRAPETRGGEASGEDYFAGQESVGEVMDEVREKDDD